MPANVDTNDQLVLRIFAFLFVNAFMIGAAVAIHSRGLWFPEEDNWLSIGALFMMAAVFIEMVAFMAYKVFFQERLEDQAYISGMVSQGRRQMKRMSADMQKFTMALDMEKQKKAMESAMNEAKKEIDARKEDDGSIDL
jgi:hypothetical protein|tara:strand:- start:77 stop:493 length:417 start_codon:yes stop_codon:yes gene_type:complete